MAHVPLQSVLPFAHEHALFAHIAFAEHGCPHMPQFFGSNAVLVHAPLQFVPFPS